MENRPAPLRSRRVCRFCLTESEPLNFIYERDHSKPFQVPLTLQIMSCVAIEVYSADGMPQMICGMCRWNLDRSYKFKMQCKKADEALRDYPLSGVLPRPFPPISNDPPADISNKRAAESKLQNETNKKLRTDNDNRENREKRETRERDRERQGDKQRDKSSDYYEEDGGSEEGEQEERTKEERKLEPGEIRVHACDQCDRTFPLRQALILHIVRAHRDRNFKCTECERQFFSKYDLNKHMSTHSDEKPYSCTICQKQFTRLNLLQRHEKVHRDEPRYACQHCDREFFTTEDLEKHEDAMHKKDKPFECNICNKRFQYKQGLERHEMLHSEEKTYACDYCKEAFHTSTKLARHLSTHAGHRPFMCKLCPRTFLLSHHLTRHMRTHSVEKRHVCEDCGKAFKRKESLEVHQLTHTKRGMGLTCDVCQESCRNRADYVTHIKQHIEAGEKMGPDGLQPENKAKTLELDSEEEEEEEDQYSDNDDDYMPPPYIAKKLPKSPRAQHSSQQQGSEEEEEEEDDDEEREEREEKREERQEKEERKEQVVYVRGKDGTMLKKTLKTLMPIQRRDVQEQKVTRQTTPTGASPQTSSKGSTSSQVKEDSPKTTRVDDTEAQVQKIVASVFKEHKIPLKHQNTGQDQSKESATPVAKPQGAQEVRKDGDKAETSTPKSINTVKVIKRIVLRKSAGAAAASNEGTPVSTPTPKEASASETPGSHKVRRVIVRRIIRQGDTTREVIMNPDGTAIDPAELAKLPTGNVVKRVVVKRPLDKSQNLVQTVLQSATEQRQKASDPTANEKFELKTTSTTSGGVSTTPRSTVAPQKVQVIAQDQDQETKEKVEQLEKCIEQQRLQIEELQAQKAQQDYEAIDEMLPERHDESEDEQQLPLKRVFVKRKQSIYDEEREYNDDTETKTNEEEKDEVEQTAKEKTVDDIVEETLENVQKEIQNASKTTISTNSTVAASGTSAPKKSPIISTNKVYTNKRYMIVKTADTSEVEEMSRELCSILETTDNVVKMQETVLSNLTQISGIATSSTLDEDASLKQNANSMEVDEEIKQECVIPMDCDIVAVKDETAMEVEVVQEAEIKLSSMKESTEAAGMKGESQQHAGALTLDAQDLSDTTSIFETSDVVLEVQKSSDGNLDESVIELSQSNDTINLNDTNDSQDSLEDKLSQMEG